MLAGADGTLNADAGTAGPQNSNFSAATKDGGLTVIGADQKISTTTDGKL